MTTERDRRPPNWSMIGSFLGVKGGAWLIHLISRAPADSGWLEVIGGETARAMLIGAVGIVAGLLAGKGTQAGSLGAPVQKHKDKKARNDWVDAQRAQEDNS